MDHPYRSKKHRKKKKSAFLRLVKIKLAQGAFVPLGICLFVAGSVGHELISNSVESIGDAFLHSSGKIESGLTDEAARLHFDLDVQLQIAILEAREENKGKQARKTAFYKEAKIEQKLCAPLFFVSKGLIAHGLYKVTCIDKEGKNHFRYKEAPFLLGTVDW